MAKITSKDCIEFIIAEFKKRPELFEPYFDIGKYWTLDKIIKKVKDVKQWKRDSKFNIGGKVHRETCNLYPQGTVAVRVFYNACAIDEIEVLEMENGELAIGSIYSYNKEPVKEKIEGLAMKFENGSIAVKLDPKHYKYMMWLNVPENPIPADNENGFGGYWTSFQRFVDRYEATAIAREAGQIDKDKSDDYILSPADLWGGN